MNTGEMPLVETLEDLPKEIAKPGNEMLKGLCFNCDFSQNCSWKASRKLYCEHFQ